MLMDSTVPDRTVAFTSFGDDELGEKYWDFVNANIYM
jgi:hypothetical protein